MSVEKVLVAIPTYNASAYVKKAVQSILDQTYKDLLCLILDDGSTDQTTSIIKELTDNRIKLLQFDHSGPGNIMNKAIQFAVENNYDYIARMDADDISLPDRLMEQMGLLKNHSNAAACSCNCFYIHCDTEMIIGSSTVSISKKLIQWEIKHGLRGLVQGASIFRTKALNFIGGYREQFSKAEEVDLFLRLLEHYQLINSPRFLYQIRLNPKGLSVIDPVETITYQYYALQCAKSRKYRIPEPNFVHFLQNLKPHQKEKINRERRVLDLWRLGIEGKPIMVLLATILDPRRGAIRIFRFCEKVFHNISSRRSCLNLSRNDTNNG